MNVAYINSTLPPGKYGLAVEPWSLGEIYAVAANWAKSSDPVLVWGDDCWETDPHGRQVADFRHRPADALESIIREAIRAGGDDPQDDDVSGIIDDAREISEG